MSRKTHRSKSHKRRHSRRHTRKYHGGRGGMGGAELGHAYQSQAYTTGASQTLYQLTGRTPGLSSGGKRRTTRRK
jgi:hypothetical protein